MPDGSPGRLTVEVTALHDRIWRGQARLVVVPAANGQLGVLPGHAPVAALLTRGTVTLTDLVGTRAEIEVDGGLIVIHRDEVIVLTDAVRDSG